MRQLPRLLATAVVAVSMITPAARSADDPVLWQLQLERAAILLQHAEEDLDRQQTLQRWTTSLPAGEQVGHLVNVAGREYRGVADQTDRDDRELAAVEAEVRRRELDLEEMRISGRMPQNGLRTPLIERRDFVGERLRVRLRNHRYAGTILQPARDMMQQLVGQGAIPWRDGAAADTRLETNEARIEEIELKLHLRAQFLAGTLPDDASFILEEASLNRRQQLLEDRLDRASVEVDNLKPLTETRFATHPDLDRAEETVRRLEQQLELLLQDRAIFEHRLAEWHRNRSSARRSR